MSILRLKQLYRTEITTESEQEAQTLAQAFIRDQVIPDAEVTVEGNKFIVETVSESDGDFETDNIMTVGPNIVQ